MTDFPTIRIKCDTENITLAGRAARHALGTLEAGQDDHITFQVSDWERSFYIRRTKTGVSVRQIIDGRAV